MRQLFEIYTQHFGENRVILISGAIFGRPEHVARKSCSFIFSSYSSVLTEKIIPLFKEIFPRIIKVGESLEDAKKTKLVMNYFLVCSLEMISETFTFGDKVGLKRQQMLEFLKFQLVPPLQEYATRMAKDTSEFGDDVGFTTRLGLKDVSHMREFSKEAGMNLPIGDIVFAHLETAMKKGQENFDWSEGIISSMRNEANLE